MAEQVDRRDRPRGLVVASLGVIGAHGATGSGGLGVELAGGMRAVSCGFHSSYHDCEQATSITALGPAAEARVRGELWLSPDSPPAPSSAPASSIAPAGWAAATSASTPAPSGGDR